VDGSITVREGHDIANAVKQTIMWAKPAVYNVLMHVEPA
jgi:divalent metal cation (Fe/Co/Zn/Cd) transporter